MRRVVSLSGLLLLASLALADSISNRAGVSHSSSASITYTLASDGSIQASVPANLTANRVFITADRTTTSTSFADVTGATFAVAANTNYAIEAHLLWSSSGITEGGNFSFNGPASPTAFRYSREIWTAAITQIQESQTAYDTGTLLTAGPGAGIWPIHLYGTLENGANAGTLALRFRAQTGGANSMTLKRGSYVVVYPF